jgi:hypothetical protein
MTCFDTLMRSLASAILLTFVWHSKIQAQSISGRALIDSNNQIVLLSPWPDDSIPDSWRPPIEKSYGIVNQFRTGGVCFAAITMNREVKIWGDGCDSFTPPTNLRDVKRLQMNDAVIVAEKFNGDYVVWGDSTATSYFKNRQLNARSEKIKLDNHYSLGYLSNEGHALTVCKFEECLEPDSCCHTSIFHDEVVRDFKMTVGFHQNIITAENSYYYLWDSRYYDKVNDFYGSLRNTSDDYLSYRGQVDAEDEFLGTEGLLLNDGLVRHEPPRKLYSMPYGNGQVLDIAHNGILFDLVLLEDGRVVVIESDGWDGSMMNHYKKYNLQNSLENALRMTSDFQAYTASYFEQPSGNTFESPVEASPKPFSENEVIFSRTNSTRDVQAIAVIPKDGENCSGQIISGDELAAFGETAMLGYYTVVDRKHFEQTLEEIKLSMAGLTFENGVLEAGCIENAQGYLFVEHGCLQNQETIKAKLIHCESSEIIWNGLGQGTTAKDTFEEIVARLNQE